MLFAEAGGDATGRLPACSVHVPIPQSPPGRYQCAVFRLQSNVKRRNRLCDWGGAPASVRPPAVRTSLWTCAPTPIEKPNTFVSTGLMSREYWSGSFADLDQLAHGSVTRLDADLATEHRRRLAAPPEPKRRL